MTDFRDLRVHDTGVIGPHFGIIAEDATSMIDLVGVILPDFDDSQTWGPCRWQARDDHTLPAAGNECLVVFDNRRMPWITMWWPGVIPSPSAKTGDFIWSAAATRVNAVLCDGSLYNSVSDPTFAALFTLLGTSQGGTGASSFAVPDIRGRMLVMKGTHADVSALHANDGLAVGSRTPKHNSSNNLSWSGSFSGTNANTGTVSADHAHYTSGSTGGMSAQHNHNSHQWAGGGGPYRGANYNTDANNVAAPVSEVADTDHSHTWGAWSGGINTNHTHNITPAGSVSGSISGSVGPGGSRPTDVPAYIVENCFIVK